MILTFKIPHNKDFSEEFKKAKYIINFGLEQRHIGKYITTKDVKQFGLKSLISNQLLRKYCKNKNTKVVKNIKLPICSQGIKFYNGLVKIPCLRLSFQFKPHRQIIKINQIEIGDRFYYISCEVKENDDKEYQNHIGIDLNSTGHCLVAVNPQTGKVLKLGKSCWHIRQKYCNIRRRLQKLKKFKAIKNMKDKERRVIHDINHKISSCVIKWAYDNKCNIKMENLKGIRKNTKGKKKLSYNLNNWSFYQLRQMIEYKAKLHGLSVIFIDPFMTSQIDSRTGLVGDRKGKLFKALDRVENSDVNAAFNIALTEDFRLSADRDVGKGRSGEPQVEMTKKAS